MSRQRRSRTRTAVASLLALLSILLFAAALWFARGPIRRFVQNDATDPTSPTALVARSGGTVAMPTVELEWDAATDNVGVTHYLVFRDTDDLVGVVDDGTTWTDDMAGGADERSYQVVAMDERGNASPRTESVLVRLPGAPPPDLRRPSQPEPVALSPDGDDVTITWEEPADDVGVTGYRIFRDVDVLVAEIGQVPSHEDSATAEQQGSPDVPPATSFVDTDVSDGRHTYQVAAFDGEGRFSERSEPTAVEVGRDDADGDDDADSDTAENDPADGDADADPPSEA